MEAVNFAAIKHKNQRRKDPEKTPYINHPIGVAYILWKEGGVTDLDVLQVSMCLAHNSLLYLAVINRSKCMQLQFLMQFRHLLLLIVDLGSVGG